MADTRKSIKAAPAVKRELEAIQAEIKVTAPAMKNESLTLAYLQAMYRHQKSKITLPEHQKYLREAEEANNQASL
jgi:hypothetical protein